MYSNPINHQQNHLHLTIQIFSFLNQTRNLISNAITGLQFAIACTHTAGLQILYLNPVESRASGKVVHLFLFWSGERYKGHFPLFLLCRFFSLSLFSEGKGQRRNIWGWGYSLSGPNRTRWRLCFFHSQSLVTGFHHADAWGLIRTQRWYTDVRQGGVCVCVLINI